MFRKLFIKSVAAVVMSAFVAGAGATAASAGGYGHGNSYGHSKSFHHKKHHGHHKRHGFRKRFGFKHGSGYGRKGPFGNVNDRTWNRHVSWCHGRFKSYKSFDNSYKPYRGPRQQCWSPFIRG